MNSLELMKIVESCAIKNGVDPDVAIAIASVESGWDTWASRFEPGWRYLKTPEIYAKTLGITVETETKLQCFSYGLMQVMGSVARELGFEHQLTMLTTPQFGAEFGTKKLATLFKKHHNEQDVISAYNQGTPKKNEQGKFNNQGYVDKVTAVLDEMRRFVAAGRG